MRLEAWQRGHVCYRVGLWMVNDGRQGLWAQAPTDRTAEKAWQSRQEETALAASAGGRRTFRDARTASPSLDCLRQANVGWDLEGWRIMAETEPRCRDRSDGLRDARRENPIAPARLDECGCLARSPRSSRDRSTDLFSAGAIGILADRPGASRRDVVEQS